MATFPRTVIDLVENRQSSLALTLLVVMIDFVEYRDLKLTVPPL
jgi:hypothetical protein